MVETPRHEVKRRGLFFSTAIVVALCLAGCEPADSGIAFDPDSIVPPKSDPDVGGSKDVGQSPDATEASDEGFGPAALDFGPGTDVPRSGDVNRAATPNCESDLWCLQVLDVIGPCFDPWCRDDGTCDVKPRPEGSPCNDNNVCTSDDACYAAQCGGIPLECDDGNECTEDQCQPFVGECDHVLLSNMPCEDGDACTGPDACQNGHCASGPPSCQGCQNDAECSLQEDGNLCNGTLHCVNSECVVKPGTPVDCSGIQTSPCESVSCVPALGVCSVQEKPNGSQCEAASACEGLGSCQEGVCEGSPIFCDDGVPCTKNECDDEVGCVYPSVPDGVLCNDGSQCTHSDKCTVGECIGVPVDCNDNDPCTKDSCQPGSGCIHAPDLTACP